MPETRCTDAPLNDQLRELQEAFAKQAPVEVRQVMVDQAEELARSGVAERSLGVGEKAPAFELPGADGDTVRLDELLRRGPVVLSFYRGGWCPYCNLELAGPATGAAGVQAVRCDAGCRIAGDARQLARHGRKTRSPVPGVERPREQGGPAVRTRFLAAPGAAPSLRAVRNRPSEAERGRDLRVACPGYVCHRPQSNHPLCVREHRLHEACRTG